MNICLFAGHKKIPPVWHAIPAVFFYARRTASVRPFFPAFDVVYERTVYYAVAAYSRVISREIPVSRMSWAGLVKPVYALENDAYAGVRVGGSYHPGYHVRYLSVGKRCIDIFHVVDDKIVVKTFLSLAFGVYLLYYVFQSVFLEKGYGGSECYKVVQTSHIYAVAVRIAYLRCAGQYDYVFGIQTVHYAHDALTKGSAAHDRVVDKYQVVRRFYHAVSHVVNVGYHIVARRILGYECS